MACKHQITFFFFSGTSQRNIEAPLILQNDDYNIEEVEKLEKSNFLNELGLIQECDDDDIDEGEDDQGNEDDENRDENWEDCLDQEFIDDLTDNVNKKLKYYKFKNIKIFIYLFFSRMKLVAVKRQLILVPINQVLQKVHN